jgi:hypothetical protein
MLSNLFTSFAGSSHETKVTYLPLLPKLREIRLLELTASKSAQLRNVPLESVPSYIALSYAWSDAQSTATYTVNDERVLVRKSLSNALSRVFNYLGSNPREPRYVWADAICIDQSNDVEKAAQVAIMSEIYQKAHQVIVYLGEPPFWNFGIAEKNLAAWGNNSRLFGDLSNDGFRFDQILKQVHYEQQPSVDSPQLASFFQHSWWNRIWTVQEICFGRSAIVISGNQHMDWNTIARAAELW